MKVEKTSFILNVFMSNPNMINPNVFFSGLDKDGKIVCHSSLSVKHISGRNILDNHSVNLISTVLMGVLTPMISKEFWPVF